MFVATKHHHVGLKFVAEMSVKTGEYAVEKDICERFVTTGATAIHRHPSSILFTELNPVLTGLFLAVVFQVFLGSGGVSDLVGDDASQHFLQTWFTFL